PNQTPASPRARPGTEHQKGDHNMRKRFLLIAAPLVVVAIAASVAVAAPSDAEHSRGPRLDKLHAERPTAASDSTDAAPSITYAGALSAIESHNYCRSLHLS